MSFSPIQENTVQNLLQSAIEAQKKQDYYLAERCYRQVLSIEPNNLEALLHLALICLNLEQPNTAIQLLLKATVYDENNPKIFYNLALAYQQENNLNSAIHYYKLAIKFKPDFSLAHNNLGVAYQYLGDILLANQSFTRAFHYTPSFVDAYFNHSQSYHYTKNDSEKIEYIKKILHSGSLNLDEKIKINFTLGKIHDDLKMYDVAFDHYKKGNDLKNQGFNISHYQQYVDKIIDNFDQDMVQSLPINHENSSGKRLVFIIGMPRSGSTLVEKIIEKHSAASSAGETGFIGEIVDELPNLINSQLPYPNCIKDMSHQDLHSITESLQDFLYKLPHDSHIIIEKSPINFLHIGLILTLFPDSIIIHTERNPVSTCLSCYFQNFNRQHQYSYNLQNLAFFHNEYTRLMRHWHSIFPNQIFNTSYERLVENQLEESKNLTAACGLAWEEECLSFYDSDSTVSTASKWQVRKPIYKTSVDKWKHYEPYISDLTTSLKTI